MFKRWLLLSQITSSIHIFPCLRSSRECRRNGTTYSTWRLLHLSLENGNGKLKCKVKYTMSTSIYNRRVQLHCTCRSTATDFVWTYLNRCNLYHVWSLTIKGEHFAVQHHVREYLSIWSTSKICFTISNVFIEVMMQTIHTI